MSAARHEPDWHFSVFSRNLDQDDLDWIARQPNATLRNDIPTEQKGWNVKPALLSMLIGQTGGPVVWCDTDIILAGPISPLLRGLPEDCLVATQEYRWGRTQGSAFRTAAWGFAEARRLPRSVNTCILRVGRPHLGLIDAWRRCLERPDYKAAQAADWAERPTHMIGDQDALTALLASADFSGIPMHLLREGRDIAQCFEQDGYEAFDRLRNAIAGRVPPLIHAQGGKPWKTGKRTYYQQLSPYVPIAAPYVAQAGLPADWLRPESFAARVFLCLGLGEPSLRGILPAIGRELSRIAVHLLNLGRRRR